MAAEADFLQYGLAALVALAGLPAGIFLSRHALGELREGRTHFLLLGRMLLVAAFAVPIAASGLSFLWKLAAYGAVILAALLAADSRLSYAFLAMAFLFSSRTPYFALTASLIFLYGLPAGGLIAAHSEKTALERELPSLLARQTLRNAWLLAALPLRFFL